MLEEIIKSFRRSPVKTTRAISMAMGEWYLSKRTIKNRSLLHSPSKAKTILKELEEEEEERNLEPNQPDIIDM